MSENHVVGMLDTSVLIDLEKINPDVLPDGFIVSAVSLGELGAGVHTTNDPVERQLRISRNRMVELQWETVPFDVPAAQHYATLYAHTLAVGRNPRSRRLDLMIAATAASYPAPLYTRNPDDFKGLEHALTVVAV